MTKRRSWASWFPIAKASDYQQFINQYGPPGQMSEMNAFVGTARNQNSWGAMKNPALMTNEERAYLGLGPRRSFAASDRWPLAQHKPTGGNNG